MLSFIRKSPLPRQLGLGTFMFVIAIFLGLMFIINQLFSNQINQIVTSHQQKEVELVAEQLSSKYSLLDRLSTRNGKLLNNALNGVQIDQQNTISLSGNQIPSIKLNDQVLNGTSTFIKQFADAAEIGVELVLKQNNQFIRVASSQSEIGDKAALGQLIPSTSRVYKALSQGNDFTGPDSINDQDFFVRYAPVSNTPNLYYGLLIPYDTIVTPLAKVINNISFGKSGYIYVTDAGLHKGKFIIHPSLAGKNLFNISPDINPTFEKMFDHDSGQVTYNLKVQGHDTETRTSKAVFTRAKGWNWVVTLKSYNDEYQAEINGVLWVVSGICAAAAILLTLILWLFIRRALKPLQEISYGLDQLGHGNLSFRFPIKKDQDSRNEIDRVQNDIIRMRDNLIHLIEKVQESSQALLASSQAISNANLDLKDSANGSKEASIQVASAITQISASIEEVAQSSTEVSEESVAVQQATENGHLAVQRVEQTVAKLSSAFAEASNTIENVEVSSKSIGAEPL